MKTFSFFLIVTGIVFFVGCKNEKTKPVDFLSEDAIVQVIVDMHIADAILIDPSVQQKQLVVNNTKYYQSVLNKHSISKERFQENLDYYSENPEKFDLIYERVIEELTIIQGSLIESKK